jgi:hypothetical protein
VNVPSERDSRVAVRAYLTDETFGYTHWRAAQFSAPDAEVKRWAILTLFDSREARDAAVAKLREPADPPVSEGEHSTCATKETPETPDGIPPQPREPETPRDLNIGAWPKPKGESGDQRSRRLDPGRGRFRG